MTPQGKEKRRHARLDIALSVSYAVQQDGGEISEMAETLSSDISASGIRLMTSVALEKGSILSLEISIQEEGVAPIRAQGEVVWQQKIAEHSYETGTVIKHMEESDKARMMSFVFDQMSRLVGSTTEAFNKKMVN